MKTSSAFLTAIACAALTACSSGPKTPDWQLEAKGSTDRAVAAYLEGNTRVEAVEFARARNEISSTGNIDLIAKVELLRCATRVASLVFEPCTGFEKLRQDAAPAERAYADYLMGTLSPQNAALLPESQRSPGADAEPLSKLVAAGARFRAGNASPALIQQAVDTASAQGWRRPLLAWLGVQASLAEKAGDLTEAARLKRRMELTANEVKPPAGVAKP
ncbi:MAG: hypothetical protein HYX42_01465 [Polaromonas sp.]|uniref:hypothetical protein n=1 Tax=Polaromonas sp. TaxID=1869339 RepID=UPI0025FCAE22|nr:hypothetical protein [Polaromonas sp.]MBI2724895.1 hypothetical protein [Polaromonas sp.]